jgi:DNA-binding HxlR family transcriptional regulator
VNAQVRLAADLLERRWLIQVVVAAHSGAVRFNEFGSAVVGISPRMLSSRLRDLEQAGLVQRIVIPDTPPGVEYRLTDRGRALGPLVEALRRYAGG